MDMKSFVKEIHLYFNPEMLEAVRISRGTEIRDDSGKVLTILEAPSQAVTPEDAAVASVLGEALPLALAQVTHLQEALNQREAEIQGLIANLREAQEGAGK